MPVRARVYACVCVCMFMCLHIRVHVHLQFSSERTVQSPCSCSGEMAWSQGQESRGCDLTKLCSQSNLEVNVIHPHKAVAQAWVILLDSKPGTGVLILPEGNGVGRRLPKRGMFPTTQPAAALPEPRLGSLGLTCSGQ